MACNRPLKNRLSNHDISTFPEAALSARVNNEVPFYLLCTEVIIAPGFTKLRLHNILIRFRDQLAKEKQEKSLNQGQKEPF